MNVVCVEYKNKNSILNPILYLIFGIIMFVNPGEILNFLSGFISFFIAILGISNLWSYFVTYKKLGVKNKLVLVSAISLLILAIVILFITDIIEITSRVCIGTFIISNGIMRIIEALKNKNKKFIISIILGLLIVLCGFWILLSFEILYKTIGIIIIIFSILDIAGYFIYRR